MGSRLRSRNGRKKTRRTSTDHDNLESRISHHALLTAKKPPNAKKNPSAGLAHDLRADAFCRY
jgi:hypothetical protein